MHNQMQSGLFDQLMQRYGRSTDSNMGAPMKPQMPMDLPMTNGGQPLLQNDMSGQRLMELIRQLQMAR